MMDFDQVSRRRFLSTAAGAAAAWRSREAESRSGRMRLRIFREAITMPGTKRFPGRLQPFPMTQVQLRKGVFLNAMEINTKYLAEVPNDRLLHMFRVTAGLALDG